MTRGDLARLLRHASVLVSKHSPEILTGIGIAGMVATAVLAVKATPKAMTLIEDEKHRRMKEMSFEDVPKWSNVDGGTMSTLDVVKTTWRPYLPAIVLGVTSVICLISSCSMGVRRTAALATAYELSEAAHIDYKKRVLETIGESAAKEIKDKASKDQIDQNPAGKNEIIITGKGKTLCYDGHGGRYFESDMDHIQKAENILNRKLITEDYASLNDFYEEIGLSHTSLGETLGWSVTDGHIDIEFSSQLSEDGTPCLVIDYNIKPRYDYYRFT